ncbi:MAG: OmpA family protein [Pirellulales bacterium]|nr:OmpA family protein [Pirellulales bacterium]
MSAFSCRRWALIWTSLFLVPLGVGCAASQGQLQALKTQNRSLTEQTQAQATEIENLKVHSRNIENQLQRTEEEMALLENHFGLDEKGLAQLRRNRRAAGPGAAPGVAQHVPRELRERLAEISRRYPSLQFDAQTGIAKLDTDILFDSGDDELKSGAKQLLAEVARALKTPDARDLHLMVVGHTDDRLVGKRPGRDEYPTNFHLSTARALAVARQLTHAGIATDRMGVAGFGSHQPVAPNLTDKDRRKNRRVELFVMAPNVPVVGWTETIPNLY